MPRALRVCGKPGCPTRTPNRYCERHTTAPKPHGRSGRTYNGHRHRKLTAIVVQRDKGVCHLCGKPGATSADHIIPVALGGAEYDTRNMKAAHVSCNVADGARIAAEKARRTRDAGR